MALSIAAVFAFFIPTPPAAASTAAFLGEVVFPTDSTFQGTPVGGLSAIAFDARKNRYLALSDDGGRHGPPRFYTLAVDLTDGRLDPGDVVVTGVTRLLGPKGRPFPTGSVDPEGIAVAADGTLYIASEGNADALVPPFVRRFSMTGEHLEDLPVPAYHLPAVDGSRGVRHNLAFESLTLSPDGSRLTVAHENALIQDGPAADVGVPTACRVLVYDLPAGRPVREPVYPAEPVPLAPDPADGFRTNGLVELLAIDDAGTYMAMERAFSRGRGNTVKLYIAAIRGGGEATGMEGVPRPGIQSAEPGLAMVMRKTLFLNIADLGVTPENLEGMTFGPDLPDGRKTLVLVSDNNFSRTRPTQFIALAVHPALLGRRVAETAVRGGGP